MISASKPSYMYMTILILLPVLAQYSIAGGIIDFDVITMVLLLYSFFITNKRIEGKFLSFVIVISCYTVIAVSMNLIHGTLYAEAADIILRSGRYCLYVWVTLVIGFKCFHYRTAMRIYRIIAYLALMYILIQTCFYYTSGITLPNRLNQQAENVIDMRQTGRFMAFYSEPADMTYSIIPFICCSLFGPKYEKKRKDRRIRDSVFITLAVVLTTSGQGVFCALFLWVIWIARALTVKRLTLKVLMTIASVFTMFSVLYEVGILDFALDRIWNNGESNAWVARRSGYSALVLLSPLQRIFGAGYGNYFHLNTYGLKTYGDFVYFSSLTESLFCGGIIGTLIMSVFLIHAYRKGTGCQKILLLSMLILSIGGCPFTGKYLPLYFSLILCKQKTRKRYRLLRKAFTHP